MFIVSMKMTKRKLFLGLMVSIIALVGTLTIIGNSMAKAIESSHNDSTAIVVKGSTDILMFIETLGWEVNLESCNIKEVVIPTEFNDTYNVYNQIQVAQGYDLQKYMGKKVNVYTYEVLNYPEHEKNIRINIIVYEDTVVGGDVSSIELDGFMHGFVLPKQAT